MGPQVISLFQDDFGKLVERTSLSIFSDKDINSVDDYSEQIEESRIRINTLDISNSYTCYTCDTEFQNVTEQRDHFKTDFHAYNVKQKLQGLPPISRETFCLMEKEETLNSESDSEESSEELQSFQINNQQETDDISFNMSHMYNGARIYFINDQGKIFGVYRSLLHKKQERPTSQQLLQLVQRSHRKTMWAILLVGGGHFSGAIYDGPELKQHKTIHSYTVRAKQGSTQSSRDASGRHPKSAGSSLRRYNEQSFAQHVQERLEQWQGQLADCHIIFYHAAGHNKKLLFENPSPIKKTDPRLRTIPVSSQKAKLKEVERIHRTISSVEVFDSSEIHKITMNHMPKKHAVIEERTLKNGSIDPLTQPEVPEMLQNSVPPQTSEICQLQTEQTSLDTTEPRASDRLDTQLHQVSEGFLDTLQPQDSKSVLVSSTCTDNGTLLDIQRAQTYEKSVDSSHPQNSHRTTNKENLQASERSLVIDQAKNTQQPQVSNTLLFSEKSLDSNKHKTNQHDGSSEDVSLLEETHLEDCRHNLPIKTKRRRRRPKAQNKDLEKPITNITNTSVTIPVESLHNKNHTEEELESNLKIQTASKGTNVIQSSKKEKKLWEKTISDNQEQECSELHLSQQREKGDSCGTGDQVEMEKSQNKRKRRPRKKNKVSAENQDSKQGENDQPSTLQTQTKASLLCNQCSLNLAGRIPFQYNDFKFCSIQCLKLHRTNAKANKV